MKINKKVNRIEVIDENGRSYTNYNVKEALVDFQDNGATLKIFVTSEQIEAESKESMFQREIRVKKEIEAERLKRLSRLDDCIPPRSQNKNKDKK